MRAANLQAGEPAGPVVQLTGITKAYRMGNNVVPALKGVSLRINDGEIVALVGPSGSGKSTLLNICGLLDTTDSGSYVFGEQDTSTLGQRALTLFRRANIGFVFQGFNLVPVLTAFDNVEVPLLLAGLSRKDRIARTNEALEMVGLGQLTRRRPDELSGGERQRVAIARALVPHPRLVLADEPTANLDSTTALQVIDVMREAAHTRRTTFLVATHDDRMAAHCDRIITMRDGVLS